MPPVVPPVSATLIWALPTNFDEIRCLAWEEGETSWRIAIQFGNDTIQTELVPNLGALWAAVDVLWRGLVTSNYLTLAAPGSRRTRTETTYLARVQ
jgi:hypothetical protein